MLKTKVLLSSVTNLSDARYAAGMGVDYIGFSLNPDNPHFVTSEDVNTIGNWLSGVSLVGELDSGLENYGDYNIDYLLIKNQQLVGEFDEPILVFDVDPSTIDEVEANLNLNGEQLAFVVLKFKARDWHMLNTKLATWCAAHRCFLATDFNAVDLDELLSIQAEGIVLYGSDETKPGLSSYEGIADILEQLELD